MKHFLALTILFLKQFIRRKSLWIVFIVFAAMMMLNYYIQSQLERAIAEGVRYDIATKQTISSLQTFASQIRVYAVYLILIVSALVAPASRKDGTTHFVLTLSVSRLQLALSQYSALSIFVFISVIIVHVGYVVAAHDFGIMTLGEIMFSWLFLLLPLMLLSAAVFSFSLSCRFIVTLIIFLAVPYVLLNLAEYAIIEFADYVPMAAERFIDNLQFFFPPMQDVIIWPRISMGTMPKVPPIPDWTWQVWHTVFASLFWIVLGYFFYKKHDLGSRPATK